MAKSITDYIFRWMASKFLGAEYQERVGIQVEAPARGQKDIPEALQRGKVLSAVYRVGPYMSATGTPQGYALRLMVEPKRNVAERREPLAVAN